MQTKCTYLLILRVLGIWFYAYGEFWVSGFMHAFTNWGRIQIFIFSLQFQLKAISVLTFYNCIKNKLVTIFNMNFSWIKTRKKNIFRLNEMHDENVMSNRYQIPKFLQNTKLMKICFKTSFL